MSEDGEPVRARERDVALRRIEIAPLEVSRIADQMIAECPGDTAICILVLRAEPLDALDVVR